MQGFILTAIAAAEKCTLILESVEREKKVKGTGQEACFKSVSRTNTMQGFIFTATTAAEK